MLCNQKLFILCPFHHHMMKTRLESRVVSHGSGHRTALSPQLVCPSLCLALREQLETQKCTIMAFALVRCHFRMYFISFHLLMLVK